MSNVNRKVIKAIIEEVDYSHGIIYAEKLVVLVSEGQEEDRYIEARWSGMLKIESGVPYRFFFDSEADTCEFDMGQLKLTA